MGEGGVHAIREDQVQLTKQINIYLKNLNLNSVKEKVEEREAHLDAPPKKRLRPLPMLSFGMAWDATWGTPLHAEESGREGAKDGNEKDIKVVEGDYYGPSNVTDEVEAQTQDTISSTLSLLQGDVNEEMKRADVRRKADAESTKLAISKMEEEVNQRFDGNDIILK